ncbi:MAG: YfiR family protein [Chitinophagaceae bacterium]|nr:MAG: YfiR family protein [Chitinophagaceae bacterium]
MKKLKKIFVLLLTALVYVNTGLLQAQTAPVKDYQIKAAFLYNLSQFISWPSSSFVSEAEPFIIAVCGNNNMANYLQHLAGGEMIDKHPIIVKIFSTKSPLTDCHIIFMDETIEKKTINEMLTGVQGKNSLTVSDASAFLEQGGMISFYNDQSRLRISLNLTVLKNTQLSLSSKLIKLSKNSPVANE